MKKLLIGFVLLVGCRESDAPVPWANEKFCWTCYEAVMQNYSRNDVASESYTDYCDLRIDQILKIEDETRKNYKSESPDRSIWIKCAVKK